MRKLVLLIIAVVVVVHLGFVAYMSADRQKAIAFEEFSKPVSRIIAPPVWDFATDQADETGVDDTATTSDARELPETKSNRLRAVEHAERSATPTAAGREYRERPIVARARRIPAFPAPGISGTEAYSLNEPETITIWYPGERKAPVVKEPAPRPALSVPVKRENRSFVDRIIGPIFKKPYGWIKALGSKLN
ncbi:MAG TPA: hypothetical protein VJL58_05605 [Pyrinomonadaceae bacterium]|nr:hypothetical protein [Pyrinomonadaceae bacterium]